MARKKGVKRKRAPRVEVPLLKEDENPNADVEYVTVGLDEDDDEYRYFKDAFSKLQPQGESSSESEASSEDEAAMERKRQKREERKAKKAAQMPQKKEMSKKMQRNMKRLTVAQLKQVVETPEVVELHDANAADPKLLVYLKAYRNTVPIPRHWCQKRRYLSGKRGFVKPPFELPAFIAATGISRIRESYLEREEEKRKDKKKEKGARMKVSRIDINFQEHHDAFFKNMTKPIMSEYGEMYYEGREKEIRNKKAKPGVISDRLRKALGMPEGYPPPWLLNMQRHGPPPSYPNLKIPGLNCPIPEGAQWGYQAGGWGKAPVDPETNQPLYGDVFGVMPKDDEKDHMDRKLWGEMDSEDEEEHVEHEEPVAMEEEGVASIVPASDADMTEAGMTSITGTSTGTETPDIIDLRKRTTTAPSGGQAYQVIEQQMGTTGGIMGTSFTYNIPKDRAEVSLTEDEIDRLREGDTSLLRDKYESTQSSAKAARGEVEEAFVEESAKRAKREAQKKEKKKEKAFKF